MGTETMGRVLSEATIENLKDLWDAEQGLLSPEKVRLGMAPGKTNDKKGPWPSKDSRPRDPGL
jgi:hypothetical protein